MAVSSNFSPTPAPLKQTLASAYIDFTSGSNDWAQQYLPDLMESEAEVFGNRTISGFLSMVGAEEAMTSDQVVWSEQGRLHLSYEGDYDHTGGASEKLITIDKDADGQSLTTKHGIRKGDMVLVASATATYTGYVNAVPGDLTFNVAWYKTGPTADITDAKILVFGSEYAKGQTGRTGANKPGFKHYDNKPIIIKDKYEISGSDTSQIGWVEVAGEEGQNGYLWYLKAEGDTRARFGDYLEMTMVEAEKASAAFADEFSNAAAISGTEGLFAAINDRGNVATGVEGVNAATDLAEFDAILAEFDKNGAIEENMMFLNRTTALAIDDMLASMNFLTEYLTTTLIWH